MCAGGDRQRSVRRRSSGQRTPETHNSVQSTCLLTLYGFNETYRLTRDTDTIDIERDGDVNPTRTVARTVRRVTVHSKRRRAERCAVYPPPQSASASFVPSRRSRLPCLTSAGVHVSHTTRDTAPDRSASPPSSFVLLRWLRMGPVHVSTATAARRRAA